MQFRSSQFFISLLVMGGIVGFFWYPPLIPFYIFFYLNLYIHEFGHAIAGILVKFPVRKIVIGTGRAVIQTNFANIIVMITNNFLGGCTYCWGDIVSPNLKIRFMFFVLGGVLAQGLAISASIFIFRPHLNDFLNIKNPSIAAIFIYANLFQIIVNLYPRKMNTIGLQIPNDGLRLLLLPKLTVESMRQNLFYGQIGEANEYYVAKRYQEAERNYQECITTFPDIFYLKISFAITLIRQLKLDEAQSFLESNIDNSLNETETIRALFYNAMAWVYFLQFQEEALQKADKYIQKAFEICPSWESIVGTRSDIFIEQGAVEKGIELLKKIAPQPPNHQVSPISQIYLAYAYYQKHDLTGALNSLKQKSFSFQSIEPDERLVIQHVFGKTKNFDNSYTFDKFVQDDTLNSEYMSEKTLPVSRGMRILIGGLLGICSLLSMSLAVLFIMETVGRKNQNIGILFTIIFAVIAIGTMVMGIRLTTNRGAKHGGGILTPRTYSILGWCFIALTIILGFSCMQRGEWRSLGIAIGCPTIIAYWCFVAAQVRSSKKKAIQNLSNE